MQHPRNSVLPRRWRGLLAAGALAVLGGVSLGCGGGGGGGTGAVPTVSNPTTPPAQTKPTGEAKFTVEFPPQN